MIRLDVVQRKAIEKLLEIAEEREMAARERAGRELPGDEGACILDLCDSQSASTAALRKLLEATTGPLVI